MNRRAGFSLLEVMCAIVVLGVGVAGLTQGVTTALRSSKESEVQTAAALLAASRVEFLRADNLIVEGEDDGEGDGILADYTWRESISTTSIEGLFEVKLTVEHTESSTIAYELRTLLFDPPVSSTSTNSASDLERNPDPRRKGGPKP